MIDYARECRQLIAQLELISHAPTKNPDPTPPSSEPKGGTRPPGGLNRKDDSEPEFMHKSYEHFRRRFNGCKVDADYERLARDAAAALKAWRHSPGPPRESDAWRESVASDTGKAKAVAARWNISASYVYTLRRKYGRAA